MQTTKSYFQFQRIVLRSLNERGGKVLKLYPRTLIDSEDNTKGKSTLINSLFWGLGCEVKFEETWCDDLETIVSFSVAEKNYDVYRNKEYISIIFNDTNEAYKYPIKSKKISSDFIKKLNGILNFNVLLKYANASKLSQVPPSYYFATTYIEQMTGWANFWLCFPNMNAFNKNNRTELIKYICGVLNQNYYEKKNKENEITQEKKELEKIIERDTYYFDYLKSFETEKYSDKVIQKSIELDKYEKNLLSLRNEYLEKASNLSSLKNEIELVNIAIGELEQDYEYSVRNVDPFEVICPTCGVIHQNDIVNKFSIVKDSDLLLKRIDSLTKEKNSNGQDLSKISRLIQFEEEKITGLLENNDVQEYLNYSVLQKKMTPTIQQSILNNEVLIKENETLIKEFESERKLIQSKNQKGLESEFVDYFEKLCKDLEIAIGKKKTFTQILNHTSGGANGIKLMLAIRLTLLHAMCTYAESSIPPFVIDSPRQQDINDYNYSLILNAFAKIPEDVQFIVAAVKTQPISEIRDRFEEIFIEENLLAGDEFDISSNLISNHEALINLADIKD
ncbi:hypothetical protein B9T25_02335 [Acinetobacter sp. ANC 4470]|uniref:hypothetical protein n=1 Tax=Acinetobacter sp. ANC 4470 TaxID=1977881 RepID=UPI000A342241|nr:hypothetical protein [Acinetobacter sp. ANC 4470]OTG69434.1 hypothetical protein B9T25_02335 [Acinetobacter sp. ANC 4470]